jgi:MFS family permease
VGTTVLVVTIFALMFRMPTGGWSDRFGRRLFLLIGAALGVVYPISMALSTSLALFMVSRIIFGIGLAIFTTSMKAYIADIVPPERRGEAFGINGATFSIALVGGPLSGELLKNLLGFRVSFLGGAVMAAICLVLVYFLPKVKERRKSEVSMMAGARDVLGRRGAWASIMTALTASAGFAMIFTYFPIYADELDLASTAPGILNKITVSVGFSVFAVVTFIVMPRAGRLSDSVGRAASLVPGVLIAIPGVIILSQARDIWLAYAGIGVAALGFGFLRAMMDAIMQDACPRHLRGTGVAVLFSGWDASIGVLAQVLGLAIAMSGFDLMFGIVVLLTATCGSIAILLTWQSTGGGRVTTFKRDFPVVSS